MTASAAPSPQQTPAHVFPAHSDFPQPPPGHRDWYAWEAVRSLPRLILMVDKNPFSSTYGSFDRSYWHYRTMDFPCGMHQEFVLALAMAWKLPMPGNIFHQQPRMRELAEAAIDFARRSAHPDGTCDDYFPFERALGALVFSLYAMTESAIELDLTADRHREFFAQRGAWLLNHNESGKLANHQALAALALYNVYILTGDEKFRRGSESFRDLTLSWQHDEGWFQEYEGADPGYHSCSIAFLAKLWQKSRDESLVEPLDRAVDFAWNFMHPDGSYAGEYGSRNTFHFYPHGFEVWAFRSAKAGQIVQTYLERGLPQRRRYFNDDDRMAAHYVYEWMHAWRDHHEERQPAIELPSEPTHTWFPGAKLLVVKTPRYHAVAAANKGGVFKAFTPDGPLASDTGLVAETHDGTVLVQHIVDNDLDVEVEQRDGGVGLDVEGPMHRRSQPLPTPAKNLVFRTGMLTVGRFNADAVRKSLQKVLIVGKRPQPVRFSRSLWFGPDRIEVVDHLRAEKGRRVRFLRLAASTDATSIYVANSNIFQESVLLPWTPCDVAHLEEFNGGGAVTWKRSIVAPQPKDDA